MDLDRILATLRQAGGDTASIEVKSAAGGLTESVNSTLSALSNLPGGGILILGLDEKAGFKPVDLQDPESLRQGLGSRARAFVPPVRLDIRDERIEGKTVIIARVTECDLSDKPCRVASTGKAYLRSHDGDYELSFIEQQGFLSARTAPHFDRQPVAGTSVDDLDSALTATWRDSIAARGRDGLGQFVDDLPELLRRGGVLAASGELTKAGLLALGTYPQQYLPRMVIQVALETGRPGERARNARAIDGPIPVMLDTTLEWLRLNMGSTTMQTPQGRVREVPDYPILALRELVANALIHRDLAAWSEGQAVEIRLSESKLVVSNPGGLYGITADRLGRDHITSARNPTLVGVCQNTRTTGSDERIIEALATGLRIVASELAESNLPPANYFDAGIRFTVMLTRPSDYTHAATPTPAHEFRAGSNRAVVLDRITDQPGLTVSQVAEATGLALPQARRAITELRARNHIQADAGQGKTSRYFPKNTHDTIVVWNE